MKVWGCEGVRVWGVEISERMKVMQCVHEVCITCEDVKIWKCAVRVRV